MLPDLIKELKSTPSFMHLKNISNVSTIAEILSNIGCIFISGKVS